jgi:DNA-binding response OmpR family regulator
MKYYHFTPRILAIDDDLDTLGLLRLVLQRAGYHVTTATSWEEVSNRLILSEQEKTKIDLILLDVMMPGRSGYDVYNSLQIVLRPIPAVIFLSAKSSIETIVKASDLGAAKYLTKPTTPEKLISTVQNVLQQPR